MSRVLAFRNRTVAPTVPAANADFPVERGGSDERSPRCWAVKDREKEGLEAVADGAGRLRRWLAGGGGGAGRRGEGETPIRAPSPGRRLDCFLGPRRCHEFDFVSTPVSYLRDDSLARRKKKKKNSAGRYSGVEGFAGPSTRVSLSHVFGQEGSECYHETSAPVRREIAPVGRDVPACGQPLAISHGELLTSSSRANQRFRGDFFKYSAAKSDQIRRALSGETRVVRGMDLVGKIVRKGLGGHARLPLTRPRRRQRRQDCGPVLRSISRRQEPGSAGSECREHEPKNNLLNRDEGRREEESLSCNPQSDRGHQISSGCIIAAAQKSPLGIREDAQRGKTWDHHRDRTY